VKATLHSIYGPIISAWRTEGERLEWRVEIPANTTATLYAPVADEKQLQDAGRPAVDSSGLRFLRRDGHTSVWAAGSGAYQFTGPLQTFSEDSISPNTIA
jgi:alpha-L-rhamnosidase